MKLTDYLTEKNIRIGIHGGDKRDVINQLLDIALTVSPSLNRETALKGLLKREEIGSTGIGKGIAIPHSAVAECSTIIPVIGISESGLEFDSLDQSRVRIFFMILYPVDQIQLQLKFLARVSRLLRNEELKASLLNSRNPGEIMDALQSYESEHFS